MNRKRIEQFLSYVNGEAQNITSSDWIMGPCPFAAWTHQSGKDHNPSFGIKINDDGPSGYNCFSCNRKGDNLMLMVLDLAELKAKDPVLGKYLDLKQANKLVTKHEVDMADPEDIPDFEDKGRDREDRYIFPDGWIESFPEAHHCKPAKKYLIKRQVHRDIAVDLKLKYDYSRRMICLPIVGDEGYLGMVGRSVSPAAIGGLKHHDYAYNERRNSNVMINEGRINWDDPVIVVEGMFDFIKMFSVYPNVLGMKGVSVNSRRLKTLQKSMEIYTFFDSDEAGYNARQLVKEKIGHIVMDSFVPSKVYPGAKDVDDIPSPVLTKFLSEFVRTRHG